MARTRTIHRPRPAMLLYQGHEKRTGSPSLGASEPRLQIGTIRS
ncbi:MAG: hypothetical protein ABFE13_19215 [Phycisphaerales bacterium]